MTIQRTPASLGLAALLALLPLPLLAQGTGVVRGRVTDAAGGAGVASASVGVVGTPSGAVADEEGRFRILEVPAGEQVLRARAFGYGEARRTVRVVAGDTVVVDIALTRSARELDAVRTTARPVERERFERTPSVGAMNVGGETLKRLPVIGEPDVLRVVQLLPGVVATNDFTAGYNVRGGESDQNLVLLDGHPLYNPFHLAGLFGTFIDETVAGFELLAGGFPATQGGRLSSVLDVTPRAEERRGVHGAAQLSVLATSLVLGGAARDGATSWNVGARRTYADRFVDLVSDRVLPYHFQDAQAHVVQRLPRGGSLSFTGYLGGDFLDADLAAAGDSTESGAGRFRFDWGNQLAGLTWRQPIGGGGLLRGDSAAVEQRVSWTGFRTGLDLGDGSLRFTNRVGELRLRGQLARTRGRHATTIGYEASRYSVTYDIRAASAGASLYALRQDPTALSLFVDDVWRPDSRWLVRAGVRAEGLSGSGWAALSPRASMKWFASRQLAFTLAAGRYTQWILAQRNESAPVRLFDFWIAADRDIPTASATQLVGGAERWIGTGGFVRVEGYVKRYGRLPSTNISDDPSVRGDEFIVTTGTSSGFDLLLRRLESRRLSGWLSYGYAVSTRNNRGERFHPIHDRRHNLNLVGSYTLTRRWSLGARVGFGTGVPYTDIIGQFVRRTYDPTTNGWETGLVGFDRDPVGGARNASRFPVFQRLDVSATRAGSWRGVTISPWLSLINAYNAPNVFTYVFDYTRNPPTRTALSQFPILPTAGIGLRW